MSPSRKQRFDSAVEMRRALKNAAEEDERVRLKDEYRRAEERRRHRDEERKKAAEDAARQVEQERQRQEAETRRKEILEQQRAVALRQEELGRQRKEDAERQQRETEIEAARLRAEREAEERRAKLPSTIPPPVLPTKAAESSAKLEAPRAVVTTIPGPPPERLHTNQDKAPVAANKPVTMVPASMKRAFAAVAGIIVVVMIISAIVFVYKQTTGNRNVTASSQTQPQAMPQSNPTANEAVADRKPPDGMVYVPGGTFVMGRNKSDGGDEYESPAHSVTVEPFFIDIYEVTNEDYAKFVKATNHKAPKTWTNGSYTEGDARKPVTGVSWQDANAYAKRAGKTLPTEEEWEFAARGADGRRYPWGNSWQQGDANANGVSNSTADVGAYKGQSPFGAFDMVGNVWEWTSSDLKAYEGGKLTGPPTPGSKVIRGGNFLSDKDTATATYRWALLPANDKSQYSTTGFRCAKEIK
jgi:formylglycine-generating enzyme required for sulfatase activity